MSEERKLLWQTIETVEKLTEKIDSWNEILEQWNVYLNQLEARVQAHETRLYYVEIVILKLLKKLESMQTVRKTPI